MYNNIKVIGFDADDTLWVNEPYFQETEKSFCALLKNYASEEEISKELFKTEVQNLPFYGFGAKAFMLSMIETALKVSMHQVGQNILQKVIDIGKELIEKPIELLQGVLEVLDKLQQKKYKLIVATKGDLLDQERKLQKSGLEKYFHHIEIMSNKKEGDYSKLIKHLDIRPNEFLMIGNSMKSDILPIINLGGNAIYVPYHMTWEHEKVDENEIDNNHFTRVGKIHDVLRLIE